MHDTAKIVVMALANNRMNVTKAARSVYICRQTADYWVRKLRIETGLDPLDFYDLIKLVEIVKNDESKGEE